MNPIRHVPELIEKCNIACGMEIDTLAACALRSVSRFDMRKRLSAHLWQVTYIQRTYHDHPYGWLFVSAELDIPTSGCILENKKIWVGYKEIRNNVTYKWITVLQVLLWKNQEVPRSLWQNNSNIAATEKLYLSWLGVHSTVEEADHGKAAAALNRKISSPT